ncbi:glycosyltransferase family 87 protein [Halovenus salina]|uniref:Glycosyltransferase family 87 protein n=1 Tax=Halovenus salina TaxID=1510225 RepID=A0ABD5VYY1_9EURY|nr:glycosyltransferase family 87 protein [Halovenus salina]
MGRFKRLQSVADQRPERLALVFGLLTGVLGVVLAAVEFAEGQEIDYQAYYFAGRAVVKGEPFVGWAITDGSFLTEKAYVYTPVTAPVFSVYGALPRWQFGYVLNVVLLMVVFYLIGRLVLTFLDRHGVELERVDRLLILGFSVFSGHSILGIYRGNVDPIVLLALGVGLLAIERGEGWKGGTLWAATAHFKLFPAFLGVWLLYRRAYRAIAAAVVTGLGLIALGVVFFGIDAHIDFVEFIVNERSREGYFAGGLDPEIQWITLRRPLSQFVSLSGNQLFVVTTALVAPFVYRVYRHANSELDRTVAFFATMVAMLITIVPSTLNYVVYLYFPLLGLVYMTEDPTAKRLFIAGLILVNLPLYPQHIDLIVGALPLGVVGDAVTTGARAVLTYTSIPLVGFLCILAGCIRFVQVPNVTERPAE